MTNPLRTLGELGQSLRLDSMRRSLVTSGELQKLIERDGLKGITSNPAIFETVIRGSSDYDDTRGFDGYVSLEVSPFHANDTERTLEDARHHWTAADRRNLMITIPATEAGIPAFGSAVFRRHRSCLGTNVGECLVRLERAVTEALA